MYRPAASAQSLDHSVVNKPVGAPDGIGVIEARRNVAGTLHEVGESARLPQSLRVVLVNPLLGAVGAYHYKGDSAVESLSHSGSIVEESGSAGTDQGNRKAGLESHAEGNKSGRTLVDHNMARKFSAP